MEDLTSLMSIIDTLSKSFPEGEYLKACNHMKNLYKVVPRATSPEATLPRINTQRRPLPFPESESDSESDEDDGNDFQIRPNVTALTDEVYRLSTAIGRCTMQIRQRESQLRYRKTKQRITAAIRKDAVREYAQECGLLRLRQYTMEELRARGHNIPNERMFYKEYLERHNMRIQNYNNHAREEIAEMANYRETLKQRYRDAYTSLYGRPPA